jgi:hypothetical protein
MIYMPVIAETYPKSPSGNPVGWRSPADKYPIYYSISHKNFKIS